MVAEETPPEAAALSDDFTVRLDRVFSGPMDLLLHLVREQEVEIHEIEIARILEGYLSYLTQLESTDIEFAGEFVVMAASLMAVKSRSLLPHEEVDLAEELDPRDELIQRLIEYRRFREASEDLGRRYEERALIHPRGWRGEVKEHEEAPSLDLSDLTPFDLLSHFARLLRETGANRPHQVLLEERPLRYYVEDMVGRLRVQKGSTLAHLVGEMQGGATRENLIGSFCALLELVKLGLVLVEQEQTGQSIEVSLRDELEDDVEDLVRAAGFADEEEPEGASSAAAEPAEGPAQPELPLETPEVAPEEARAEARTEAQNGDSATEPDEEPAPEPEEKASEP